MLSRVVFSNTRRGCCAVLRKFTEWVASLGAFDLFLLTRVVNTDTLSINTHHSGTEMQSITVANTASSTWTAGEPSYTLDYGGTVTECIAYDAEDWELEVRRFRLLLAVS